MKIKEFFNKIYFFRIKNESKFSKILIETSNKITKSKLEDIDNDIDIDNKDFNEYFNINKIKKK